MARTGVDTILGSSDTRPSKRQAASVAGNLDQQTATVQRLAKVYQEHGSVYEENRPTKPKRPMSEATKAHLARLKKRR